MGADDGGATYGGGTGRLVAGTGALGGDGGRTTADVLREGGGGGPPRLACTGKAFTCGAEDGDLICGPELGTDAGGGGGGADFFVGLAISASISAAAFGP
jgi:hypothetical protein